MTRRAATAATVLTVAALLLIPVLAYAEDAPPGSPRDSTSAQTGDTSANDIVNQISVPAPPAAREDDHGWYVSWVARFVDFLHGFNHGQVVSSFARSDRGKQDRGDDGQDETEGRSTSVSPTNASGDDRDQEQDSDLSGQDKTSLTDVSADAGSNSSGTDQEQDTTGAATGDNQSNGGGHDSGGSQGNGGGHDSGGNQGNGGGHGAHGRGHRNR